MFCRLKQEFSTTFHKSLTVDAVCFDGFGIFVKTPLLITETVPLQADTVSFFRKPLFHFDGLVFSVKNLLNSTLPYRVVDFADRKFASLRITIIGSPVFRILKKAVCKWHLWNRQFCSVFRVSAMKTCFRL